VKRSIWRDEAVIASLGNSWTLNRVTYGLLTFRNIIFKQLYHQLLLFIHVRPTTHRRRQHHDRSPIHLLPQTTRRSHTISQHLTLPVSLDLQTLPHYINRSNTTNPSTMCDTRRLSRSHVLEQVDWDTVWTKRMRSG
jgi:hypothetical protein